MRPPCIALVLTLFVLGTPACGGASFGPGGSSDGGGQSGSSSGGGGDGGSRLDAGGDSNPPPTEAGEPPGTYCGPDLECSGTGMQQGKVCCVTDGNPPAYACAGAECGCATQLDCARDDECGTAMRCCIFNRMDSSCPAGHYVASCAADCVGGAHLCVPGGGPAQCIATQACSPDTTSVGLPLQAGFGVCK